MIHFQNLSIHMIKLFKTIFWLLIFIQSNAQLSHSKKYQTMALGLFTPLSPKAELDTISILIQDNIHVFKITSHWASFSFGEDDQEDEVREEKITRKYYAFDSKTKNGFYILGDSILERNLRLDSFLVQRFPQYSSDTSMSLENYIYLKDSTKEYDLIETYLSQSKEKYKFPDSTILYYNSKFQDIEYGLNIRKEKQVQINKKLQKLKLVYLIDEKDLKENNLPNQMIISLELMDLPKNDLDPLLKIAEKAKQYFRLN